MQNRSHSNAQLSGPLVDCLNRDIQGRNLTDVRNLIYVLRLNIADYSMQNVNYLGYIKSYIIGFSQSESLYEIILKEYDYSTIIFIYSSNGVDC